LGVRNEQAAGARTGDPLGFDVSKLCGTDGICVAMISTSWRIVAPCGDAFVRLRFGLKAFVNQRREHMALSRVEAIMRAIHVRDEGVREIQTILLFAGFKLDEQAALGECQGISICEWMRIERGGPLDATSRPNLMPPFSDLNDQVNIPPLAPTRDDRIRRMAVLGQRTAPGARPVEGPAERMHDFPTLPIAAMVFRNRLQAQT
jgi:hypothetical protein